MTIAFPPLFPIPGKNTTYEVDLLGIQWPAQPVCIYAGLVFTYSCEFWCIMHEVAEVYYKQSPIPLVDRVSLTFAEEKYQKLLAWSDSLAGDVSTRDDGRCYVLLFQ